jgi:regulator of protease activity HflC (stomatin/prohibitin superfamily)
MEIALFLVVIAAIFIVRAVKVVPQQNAWVVERLGKYHASLAPGLNFLVPFIDKVAYKHSLKEIPLDVPSQVCITRDNTQLQVDGILYFQVTDPMRASYGSSNFIVAVTQLAQTSLRSVIGKLELDKTFEERDIINAQVVQAIDEAAALRDQGPDPAQGNPARHAGPDHRRARKARPDRGIGGAAPGANQHCHR